MIGEAVVNKVRLLARSNEMQLDRKKIHGALQRTGKYYKYVIIIILIKFVR